MNRKGLSLLEIMVATVILALITTGLANIFIVGKRYILHSRSRMTGGELGKVFLDPLYSQVRESDWSGSDYATTSNLRIRSNETGAAETLDRVYEPIYNVTTVPNQPADSQMRKVTVTVSWNEPDF